MPLISPLMPVSRMPLTARVECLIDCFVWKDNVWDRVETGKTCARWVGMEISSWDGVATSLWCHGWCWSVVHLHSFTHSHYVQDSKPSCRTDSMTWRRWRLCFCRCVLERWTSSHACLQWEALLSIHQQPSPQFSYHWHASHSQFFQDSKKFKTQDIFAGEFTTFGSSK